MVLVATEMIVMRRPSRAGCVVGCHGGVLATVGRRNEISYTQHISSERFSSGEPSRSLGGADTQYEPLT